LQQRIFAYCSRDSTCLSHLRRTYCSTYEMGEHGVDAALSSLLGRSCERGDGDFIHLSRSSCALMYR
jgi:hypothetical protein